MRLPRTLLWAHETDADQASVSFGQGRSLVPEDADDRADGQTRIHLTRGIACSDARALRRDRDGGSNPTLHRDEKRYLWSRDLEAG